MNDLQLELTRLIGRKEENEATHGLEVFDATLTDLHRWINSKRIGWKQDKHYVKIGEYTDRFGYDWWRIEILYDSNKDLLGQDKSTLREIIDLIKNHENRS